MLQIAFDRYSLDLLSGWEEVTNPADESTIVVAKSGGVGKLQFWRPNSTEAPQSELTPQHLLERLTSFANDRSLPAPQDVALEAGPLRIAAASFPKDDEFLRAWQISDGSDLVLATYTCKTSDKQMEVDDCEQIVRSLQFHRADAAT